jgi:hypothetical protein
VLGLVVTSKPHHHKENTMSTYSELTDKAAEQLLAAMQPMNELTQSLAGKTVDTVSKLPSLPTPDGVPTPLEVVTAHFAFAEKLLTAQKDFAFRLAGAVETTPKTKTSAKS